MFCTPSHEVSSSETRFAIHARTNTRGRQELPPSVWALRKPCGDRHNEYFCPVAAFCDLPATGVHASSTVKAAKTACCDKQGRKMLGNCPCDAAAELVVDQEDERGWWAFKTVDRGLTFLHYVGGCINTPTLCKLDFDVKNKPCGENRPVGRSSETPRSRCPRNTERVPATGERERSHHPSRPRTLCRRQFASNSTPHRNKIGLDVALEALRECRRKRKATIDELWEAAKICRVAKVMQPYMEAVS